MKGRSSMINAWPGWQTGRLLGEGSFGRVYEISREEFGVEYKAALKVITIPASQSDVRAAYEEGLDEEGVTRYFQGFVEEIVAEFALMSRLKGNSNIVSYEDHMVVQHDNEIGWDILIRMELLTALPDYTAVHPMTEEEVERLGLGLARALKLCRKEGIIHRDIKPENIFVSKNGDFKLGDFGIARVAEKTMSAMSRKGTYNYMAPEVYKGQAYGYTADIYSLGIVLYRYLNDGRLPFLPAYPAPLQYNDRERALNERMSGKALPRPVHGSQGLWEIIQRVCAYKPEERYENAAELEAALEFLHTYNEGDGISRENFLKKGRSRKRQKGIVRTDSGNSGIVSPVWWKRAFTGMLLPVILMIVWSAVWVLQIWLDMRSTSCYIEVDFRYGRTLQLNGSFGEEGIIEDVLSLWWPNILPAGLVMLLCGFLWERIWKKRSVACGAALAAVLILLFVEGENVYSRAVQCAVTVLYEPVVSVIGVVTALGILAAFYQVIRRRVLCRWKLPI